MLLLFSLPLHAQLFPEDVRLSDEIPQIELPEELRIQSADRIEELTLVVWGSTRNIGSDSAVGILYRQMVRGGEKIETTTRLTDDTHIPYGYVQVVSLDRSFLVLWNERNGEGTETWTTTIDMEGNVAVPEKFLEGTHVTQQGVHSFRLDTGTLLLWTDTTELAVMARKVDPAGVVLSDPYFVAEGAVIDIINLQGKEGYVNRGNLPPLLVGRDGTIGEVPEAAGKKFEHRFSIGRDGSVLTVEADTLRWYATIIDTAVSDSRQPPIFLSSQSSSLFSGSIVPFHTPENQPAVCYTTISSQTVGGGTDFPWISLWEHIAVLDEQEFWNESKWVTGGFFWFGFNRMTIGSMKMRLQVLPQCKEKFLKLFTSELTIYAERGGPDTVLHIKPYTSYSISTNGTATAMVEGSETPAYPVPVNRLRTSPCFPSPLKISRLPSLDSSRVVLLADTMPLPCAAPAAFVYRQVPCQMPVLMQRNNETVIFWKESANREQLRAAFWDINADIRTSEPVPLVRFTFLDTVTPQTVFTLLQAGTQPLLHVLERRNETGRLLHHSGLWRMETTGDLNGMAYDTSYTKDSPVWPNLLSVQQNPSDHSLLIAGRRQPPDTLASWYAYQFTPDGELRWNAFNIPQTISAATFLPLGGEDYLVIDEAQHLRRFQRDLLLTVDSVPGLSKEAFAYYDSTFIHMILQRGRLSLERRAANGQLLETSIPIPLQGAARDYFPVLNPTNSDIVLLYRWNDGITALTFDQNLVLLDQREVTVRKTEAYRPVGLFRGDTLIVVWEDFRHNRIPALYANALLPFSSLSIQEQNTSEDQAGSIRSIRPNPVQSLCTITLNKGALPGTRIALADILGRIVLSVDLLLGERSAEINTAGLPPGIYLVRLTNRTTCESRQILIH